MQQITFTPGSKVLVSGELFTVNGYLNDDIICMSTKDGIERSVNLDTLLNWHQTGNLKAAKNEVNRHTSMALAQATRIKQCEDHSEKAKQRGLEIKDFLTRLEELQINLSKDPQQVKTAIEKIALDTGIKAPCVRTIYRWHARNKFDIGVSHLIPKYKRRGGKGLSRQHPEIQKIMEQVVVNEYMTSNKQSMNACYGFVCFEIEKANSFRPDSHQFKTPSLNTFKRWIKSRSGFEIYATRNSKSAADKKYRLSQRNTDAWGFMQCVEVDHTPLDLMVVDGESGTVLGRPRLTLMVEWLTRCIVGFTIGFEGTSAQTVLECVKVAISDKKKYKEENPSSVNEWQCWGLPQFLKLDNGSEFHSQSFQISLAELGIDPIYCPRKKPWFKARVERAIKRINFELMAALPGATLTQLYNRETGNDPSEFAVIDLKNLRSIIYCWIVDDYHQTFHQGIKAIPIEIWRRNFNLSSVILPSDPNLVEILCTEVTTRRLQHYGIEIFGERTFNNFALSALRKFKEQEKSIEVKVRYNAEKLDKIWVYDETQDEWIVVPNSNPKTRDLSVFQLQLINRMRSEELKVNRKSLSIGEAREQIKKMVQVLINQKSQRSQKRALKMLGLTSDPSRVKEVLAVDVGTKEPRFFETNVVGSNSDEAAVDSLKQVPKDTKRQKKKSSVPDQKTKQKVIPPESKEVFKQIKVDSVLDGPIEIFPVEIMTTKGGRYGW